MDGTIEFDDMLPDPEGASDLYCLARGTYEMSNGEVGTCIQVGETPCIPEEAPQARDEVGRHTTLKYYEITERELVDDVLYVTFELTRDTQS